VPSDALFGNWLVAVAEAAALAGEADLERAAAPQLTRAWTLVRETTGMSATELTAAIAQEARVPIADLSAADARARGLIPPSVAHSRTLLPLSCTEREIRVAISNPQNHSAKREIASLTSRTVRFEVADPEMLAAAVVEAYGPAFEREAPDVPESTPAGPHVLVVDDEVGQRALFRSVLEQEGYRVSVAVDGPDAIEKLAEGTSYDLMTLDYWMERMNGLRVLQHIRRTPAIADIPVIMVTGAEDRRIEMSLFEAGADDYIAKPIDAPLFRLRVQAVLSRRLRS
jgi:CheY-like chemotaxis protein